MRSAIAVMLAGLVLLGVLAGTHGSALVYTLGVQPQAVATTLKAGDLACQAPLVLPDEGRFERIGVHATGGERIAVSVYEKGARRPVRVGFATPAPPADAATPPPVVLAGVRAYDPGDSITVCIGNRGRRPVDVWGTIDGASGDTSASLNGKAIGMDMSIDFERDHERSLLALAPQMAERASLFRAGWLSPAAYAVLAALVLVAVPALLLAALRAALRP
jgi:hypothetical protein